MADPGRVASGANLLAWLEREGCEHCVRLGETPGAGGVGVFASRDVERGEVLISCPTRTVISAAETRLELMSTHRRSTSTKMQRLSLHRQSSRWEYL